jgi:PAS domain S-box-containing protein
MSSVYNRLSRGTENLSFLHPAILVVLVAALSYISMVLGSGMSVPPHNVSPLWPTNAAVLIVLLAVPRRLWPLLLTTAYSVVGVLHLLTAPVGVSLWLTLGNAVEVTVAAFGIRYFFNSVPRLNNTKALAQYSLVAALLAPFAGAFIGAVATNHEDYWLHWRMWFLSDGLALFTLPPAVWGLVNLGSGLGRKTRLYYLELLTLTAVLILFGYATLVAAGTSTPQALLYPLVPLLLWFAFRFGSGGTSISVLVVSVLSIWGAVHGRGPFTAPGPIDGVLALQLFLLFTAAPFMVLAVLVEQHEQDEQALRESTEELRVSEGRLRLAQQAARIGTFERDVRTGVVTWTAEVEAMYGLPPRGFEGTSTTFFENLVHPDDRAGLTELIDAGLTTGHAVDGEWRVIWPDGSVHWIAGRWQVLRDESGDPSRVVGVNIDATERKRAEEARLELNRALQTQTALLQSNEELLKIFVKNVPAGVAMLDSDMRYLQVSDRWCADYSVESSQIVGRSHYEVFPDVPERWKEIHRRGLDGETLRGEEDQWDREGSTPMFIRWEIRPWRTPNGITGGILIFSEDITHRRLAEEALASVSRRLIMSQEQERSRIARELHDDIGQRLALVTIGLDQLRHDSPDLPAAVQSRVSELQKRTCDIATDIQSLSHELHSSKLQLLGVAVAIRGFCKEFSEQQKVDIEFTSRDVPTSLPEELSICLFRVTQEALHNSEKHSGVRRFEVQLWGTNGEIHLAVVDSGAGFDKEAAKEGRGLGLTSMQERLKLLNGTLSIETQPGLGTTIRACVPHVAEEPGLRITG